MTLGEMSEKINDIKKDLRIDGKRIFLRLICEDDATKEYLNWLKSKEVTQFLESRLLDYNMSSLKNYIKKTISDPAVIFLAIVVKENNKNIGTVKLAPINWYHKFSEIGIMIGDKNSWGKGYASETLKILSNFAFKKLKLHKLTAGAYENNVGSIRAFIKAGFIEEGRRKKQFLHKGNYVDHVLLAKFNS